MGDEIKARYTQDIQGVGRGTWARHDMSHRRRRDSAQGVRGGERRGVFAAPACARRRRQPTAVTPALIEAAQEGRQARLLCRDGPAGVRAARARLSRRNIPALRCASSAPAPSASSSGWRRNMASNILAADVMNAADAAHFIVWKRNGWLAPFVPEDVAQHYPAEHRDPDGLLRHARASGSPRSATTPTW